MGKDLESLFSTQMQNDFFPVSLEEMGAKFTFLQPDITTYEHSSGIKLTASKHSHRGDAYGYRIEEGGKTLVYCTDVEHKDGIDPNVVALSKNADFLIHDAQYTPDELKVKHGWGHSSWEQAIAVAERAGVKKLALFHHDPEHNDTFLSNMEIECRKRFADLFLAREGDEIVL
jgi:ribonuclease BN (tRNA processing enzyme)